MNKTRLNQLVEYMKGTAWDHKTPTTINYYWNTGSYAAMFFGIQLALE
jgi:hypothetical protein